MPRAIGLCYLAVSEALSSLYGHSQHKAVYRMVVSHTYTNHTGTATCGHRHHRGSVVASWLSSHSLTPSTPTHITRAYPLG